MPRCDRRATGTRASCKTKGGVPDSAVGGRAGGAVPPSRCPLPVRKVPGWRALRFPPGLWVAPERFHGAVAGAEEAGEGETPPCAQARMGCCGYHSDCGYHCDCLPHPGLGDTLAIDLNGIGGFRCGYANEKTFRCVVS